MHYGSHSHGIVSTHKHNIMQATLHNVDYFQHSLIKQQTCDLIRVLQYSNGARMSH